MDFEKRCQWCGKSFIAHKMTTLYCSKSCTGKAYKAKKNRKENSNLLFLLLAVLARNHI